MTFYSLLIGHHYVVPRGVRHRTGGVLCRVQCRLPSRGPNMQRVRILPVLLIQVTSHITHGHGHHTSHMTGQGGRSAGPALEARGERGEALTPGPAAQVEAAEAVAAGEEGETIMGEVKEENTKPSLTL